MNEKKAYETTEHRLDFDDWTTQVTMNLNILSEFTRNISDRLEKLEKIVIKMVEEK